MGRNRHFLDPSSPFYLCWQDGLLEWIDDWQPKALVVEANPRYLSLRSAIHWMHARNRPVLGWGLGAPGIHGRLASLRHWERRNFFEKLDGMIAYSQRGAAEYRNAGIPEDRVFVAPNAASPRPTSLPPVRPDQLEKTATILFVGRLQTRKRLDLLFQACAALSEVFQPHVIVVGDGPARAEFEASAKQWYPNTEFVGGRHGQELEPYFAQADLFALPGTGGLAVQQAMAHGLPVIVAQGDGTQDDLVQPGIGWQVPPNDLVVLTRTLEQALMDIPKLRKMGSEAFRIVSEEINLEEMAQAFANAVEQVTGMRLRNGQN
jgi:glycosyltransferase involved in cell wall biosynthesis